MANKFDFIIVGAGSAGCILANRLSESGRHQVLLIEAGGEAKGHWFKWPLGYVKTYFNPAVNWMFHSTPQAHLHDRNMYVPRGKVLGGSGAINAMIYVRGQQQDFDDWRDAGNPGWGFDDVFPFFQQLETHPLGERAGRGTQGPIQVSPMNGRTHPICDDFFAACQSLKLSYTADFNGKQFEGYGAYEANIRRGQRSSSGVEYLQPVRARPNLTVMTHTHVKHLLFAPNAPQQISGVRVVHEGHALDLFAHREVILSAGAVGSPQLLQCSGIGEAAWLKKIGVDVHHDLPSVGQHLQDHLCVSFFYRANRQTLNDELSSWAGQLRAGLQYVLKREGPLAMSVNQTGGFVKGDPRLKQPNLQLYFNPMSYAIPASTKASLKPDPYSGYLMAFNSCRPTSQGEIRIHSPDSKQAPLIDPAYLSTTLDQEEALQGMHVLRRISQMAALQQLTAAEVKPGLKVASDEALMDYFKANCNSIYHLCGSCAMGPDPANSVVDAQLKVHGTKGLRVIDASVFPNITSGNINAATMMVAEKGAALVQTHH